MEIYINLHLFLIGNMMFFNWLFKKMYSESEVDKLVEEIKKFNAGAIDDPLSRYIDKVYKEWKTKQV